VSYDEVKQLMEAKSVRRVEFRVTDLFGRWQQFTIPADRFTAELVEQGLGFDGSSLRGFQQIQDSDMLLMPDLDSAVYDPTSSRDIPTLAVICKVADTITRSPYSRDPRHIGDKAEEYLRSTGIADAAYFGPEPEFFIFDDVRYQQTQNTAFYYVDSVEAHWNSGRDEGPNLGYKVPSKEGYAPTAPFDTQADLRWEMHEAMHAVGITTEVSHHEVATAGQGEIASRFDTLTRRADFNQWYKHIVRDVARIHGKVATFMPKPIFGINGSGMHIHLSLFSSDGQTNLFHDADAEWELSQMALHFIGGIMEHARALCAITNPTVNSFKRLVPGYEAPTHIAWSMRNRSPMIRIPERRGLGTRMELRMPDPSCNPYLALAAALGAGLDGIRNEIAPPAPVNKNIYTMSARERARNKIGTLPGDLSEAVTALERDEVIRTALGSHIADHFIAAKRREWSEYIAQVHDWELQRYLGTY